MSFNWDDFHWLLSIRADRHTTMAAPTPTPTISHQPPPFLQRFNIHGLPPEIHVKIFKTHLLEHMAANNNDPPIDLFKYLAPRGSLYTKLLTFYHQLAPLNHTNETAFNSLNILYTSETQNFVINGPISFYGLKITSMNKFQRITFDLTSKALYNDSDRMVRDQDRSQRGMCLTSGESLNEVLRMLYSANTGKHLRKVVLKVDEERERECVKSFSGAVQGIREFLG